MFVANHAYGVKKYILGEETYMPSMGFADARRKMYNPKARQYLTPWKGSSVFYKKTRSYDETQKIVLGSDWV
jgi:hypothetical protein